NGITGVFTSGVLTLSGAATPAQYQAALQSVTFSTTSTSTTTRAISIVAVDNSLSSASATENVKETVNSPSYSTVTGNGQSIAIGSTTTSSANGTAFNSTLVGSSVSVTYTITNTGTSGLSVGSLWISGSNASDFKIATQPGTWVLPGQTTTFTLQFTPTATGSRTATINFYENESSPNTLFTFAVSGVGSTTAQPQIAVTGSSQPIADGATTTSTSNGTAFSSTAVGSSSSVTYTITNSGTAALTIGTVSIGGTNASDFKVTTQPSGSVAIGASTTFTVQFTPTASGTRAATVSFSENDPTAANPFTFAISGVGSIAAQPQIAVTGNSQPIADGATTTSTSNGTAFSSTAVGSSSSVTYTITNSGTAALTIGTVSIGGTNAGDFKITTQPIGSVAIGSSTTFTVQFTPTASGTRTATVSFSENDPTAANPFTFALSGVATSASPSYSTVTGNGQSIVLGSTTTSSANGTAFNSTLVGSSVSVTYTITNTGTSGLSVGSLWISGSNASDFKVATQPGTWVLPGQTTTFTLQFTPTATGSRTATINFYENESSPNTLFTFAVSGVGTS
ncbi:MAG TPA: choice-of-anchor D domain-containing protein, partial [Pirellulales bacterium]|nr:choice-of-anchor D domain-containing protein [Pirellulales bacterium]